MIINIFFIIKKIKNITLISKKKIFFVLLKLIKFIQKKIKKKKIKIHNFGYFKIYKKKYLINKNLIIKKKIFVPYFKCSKNILHYLNKKN